MGEFLREQARATAYTREWHVTHDWALDVVSLMDEVPAPPSRNPRTMVVRGALVWDLDDDEEAYERGLPLEELDAPEGPYRVEGGRRRVVIRAFTWEVDTRTRTAFKKQWNTVGSGFSGRSAWAALSRYVRAYAWALAHGLESRKLIVTALEVTFWTRAKSAGMV